MPPKKQKASNKTEQKRKEKIIEDKTFGLKNKKGNKQQKFVKQVNQQVKYGGDPSSRKLEQQRMDEKKKRELDKKKQAELDNLFKPTIVQNKIGKGADPKSVLCAFFKQGQCTKGDKCKFSHDLAVERKGEKRSLYSDVRDGNLEEDTMDKWDEDKLKEVVEKKHGEGNKQKQKTDIVCKFFVQAIENKKYGWFWSCPNGSSCIYRHALPPGFVLKSDKKAMEDQKEKISIEDLIEKERATLGSKVTKVTLETFLAWKKRKREEKLNALTASKAKRQKDFKSGKLLGASGREVFEFQPDMAGKDDDEADDVRYKPEEEEETEVDDDQAESVAVRGISSDMFVPEEVDATGTQASSERLASLRTQPAGIPNGDGTPANASGDAAPSSCHPSTSGLQNGSAEEPQRQEDVAVDENLFTDDLDDLEDELAELDV